MTILYNNLTKLALCFISFTCVCMQVGVCGAKGTENKT